MQSIETNIRQHSKGPSYWAFGVGALLWTLAIGYSLTWNTDTLQQAQIDLATKEARGLWNKDSAFRKWASRHGGVYVKPNQRTPPSPYLQHIPDRDLVTEDGTRLTLMNPAYMMRQMVQEFSDIYGIKGSITGKVQLNPDNKPDPWEAKVLDLFEQGRASEYTEQAMIDGRPYLRYMKPMYMTRGCVKCHGVLGFEDGDLRGGVSVSVPLQPYFESIDDTLGHIRITHAAIWLFGIAVFIVFALLARRRHRDRLGLIGQLQRDALYDKLTELPNRYLLLERLQRAIARCQREARYQFAVCFIDLDRFKRVNDSYGHRVGDQVLREATRRLRASVRPSDTVARISGDEFVCLLEGVSGLPQSLHAAERIAADLSRPMHIDSLTFALNCSIGMTLYDSHYENGEEMLRDADTAMYRAKNDDRNHIDVFDPQMHENVLELTELEHGIRNALANNELSLHYQPVIDASQGSIAGFEALLRWQHPTLGHISPDRFVPIAEDTGSIAAIGDWVIGQACQQISRWNELYGENRFFVSVNLSARQVAQVDTAHRIEKHLRSSGMQPSQLHCEITETSLIRDVEASRPILEQLSALGVRLSADDFGKGYCSLTYLQEFEFDVLKIDKQFVQDMAGGGKGLKLVKTLLLLAQDLGMSVVAEGIETQDQFDRLQGLHCRMMQGYLLCPPLPAQQISALLTAGAHKKLQLLQANNPFLKPAPAEAKA